MPIRNHPLLRLSLAAGAAAMLAACGLSENGEEEAPETESADARPAVSATVRLDRGRDGEDEAIAAVAVGEGGVWVSRGGRVGPVLRIDPESNEVVATIPTGGSLAAGEGAVWALGALDPAGEPALFRIDPETNERAETIPLDLQSQGRPTRTTGHLAVGEGGVWISLDYSPTAGEIVRIDPDTNEVAVRIPVRGSPADIAVGGGSVWVLSHPELTDEATGEGLGSSLMRIDPDANEVVATLGDDRLAVPGGSMSPPQIAIGEATVWVPGAWPSVAEMRSRGWPELQPPVFKVDIATNEVIREVADTDVFLPFAVVDGQIWSMALSGERPRIERLDPETLEVEESIPLDFEERGHLGVDGAFDPDARSLWVTAGRSAVRVDLP